MKSYYDELKTSMDKVRSRNSEAEKFSLLSVSNKISNHKDIEERQSEDLMKLDLLIKQLTDRWNNSLHFYRTRYLIKEFKKIFVRILLNKIDKNSFEEFLRRFKGNGYDGTLRQYGVRTYTIFLANVWPF